MLMEAIAADMFDEVFQFLSRNIYRESNDITTIINLKGQWTRLSNDINKNLPNTEGRLNVLRNNLLNTIKQLGVNDFVAGHIDTDILNSNKVAVDSISNIEPLTKNTNTQWLEKFADFVEKGTGRFSSNLPNLASHLENAEASLRAKGVDFLDLALEVSALAAKAKADAIDEDEAFELASEYLDALVDIFNAENTEAGIDELRKIAVKAGSSFKDMKKYLNEVKKRDESRKEEICDLISTYVAKATKSEAVAKLNLRKKIRNSF